MEKVPRMSGRRWSVRDRQNHEIYLTEERWNHIIDACNHPEMEAYEEYMKDTLRKGRRAQDGLNPQKYRYSRAFDNLVEENTHIVVIVLFRFDDDVSGSSMPNNYIVTAYQKVVW